MGAKAVLDRDRVARWQRARQILRSNLQHEETGTIGRPAKLVAQGIDLLQRTQLAAFREAAGGSVLVKTYALAGMAGLHAGLAEMLVVEHDQIEIFGARHRDRRQRPERHQLFAVAG